MTHPRNRSRQDPARPPLGERLNDRTLAVMFRYLDFRDAIIRTTGASPSPRRHARAHQILLGVALLWIIADLLLARFALPATAAPGVKVLVAALLLPPIAAIGVVWMRQLLESDELQQRIELLAMATTSIVAVCAVLLFMLLRDMHMALLVQVSAFLWLIIGTYGLTRAWLRYRYR